MLSWIDSDFQIMCNQQLGQPLLLQYCGKSFWHTHWLRFNPCCLLVSIKPHEACAVPCKRGTQTYYLVFPLEKSSFFQFLIWWRNLQRIVGTQRINKKILKNKYSAKWAKSTWSNWGTGLRTTIMIIDHWSCSTKARYLALCPQSWCGWDTCAISYCQGSGQAIIYDNPQF